MVWFGRDSAEIPGAGVADETRGTKKEIKYKVDSLARHRYVKQ